MSIQFYDLFCGRVIEVVLSPEKPSRDFTTGQQDTEEGWESTSYRYELLPDEDRPGEMLVKRTIVNDGRDCDGRLTFTREFEAPVVIDGKIKTCGYLEPDAEDQSYGMYHRPVWKMTSSRQYDEQAEKAGY